MEHEIRKKRKFSKVARNLHDFNRNEKIKGIFADF
jgi:hypothetical protein